MYDKLIILGVSAAVAVGTVLYYLFMDEKPQQHRSGGPGRSPGSTHTQTKYSDIKPPKSSHQTEKSSGCKKPSTSENNTKDSKKQGNCNNPCTHLEDRKKSESQNQGTNNSKRPSSTHSSVNPNSSSTQYSDESRFQMPDENTTCSGSLIQEDQNFNVSSPTHSNKNLDPTSTQCSDESVSCNQIAVENITDFDTPNQENNVSSTDPLSSSSENNDEETHEVGMNSFEPAFSDDFKETHHSESLETCLACGKPAHVKFIPCGHKKFCEVHFEQFLATNKEYNRSPKCPLSGCRKVIKSHLLISG